VGESSSENKWLLIGCVGAVALFVLAGLIFGFDKVCIFTIVVSVFFIALFGNDTSPTDAQRARMEVDAAENLLRHMREKD